MKAYTIEVDGVDSCSANEQNSAWQEGRHFVETAGMTPDASGPSLPDPDTYQVAKATTRYVAGANFCVDSGAANAYVLTQSGTFRPSSGSYFEGELFRARMINANTLASTVNKDGRGVVPLTLQGGSALPSGTITTNADTIGRYTSAGGGRFELLQAGGLTPTIANGYKRFLGQSISTTQTLITSIIPNDNTIPQDTEGTQILSLVLPTLLKSTSSVLLDINITAQCAGTRDAASVIGMVTALFENGIINAVAADVHATDDTYSGSYTSALKLYGRIQYLYSPGSTASKTWNVRVGKPTVGDDFQINSGWAGGSAYASLGGVINSYIRAWEVVI